LRHTCFRQLTAIFLAALVFSSFASAFAMEHIESADSGEIAFIDADNGLSYTADFYMSSVNELKRDGDNLHINTGGEITLNEFFSQGRDSRILMFADGRYVSGADFDADGGFTGSYVSGTVGEKENQQLRVEYAQNPEEFYDYTVTRDASGLNALSDGAIASGEAKQLCCDKYAELYGDTKYAPTVYLSNSLYLHENQDGALTAVKQTLKAVNGYTVVSTAPEIVCVIDAETVAARGEGRAVINYSNELQERIASLSFKVERSGDEFTMESVCPCCGENTGGEIHLASCGHYKCDAKYGEDHEIADCQIAGHCRTSDITHEICKNCRGYLCDGKQHGSGHCKHVHDWFCVSYVAPSQSGPGASVSQCLTCGETLAQTLG
jgi:hypothetical protein